MIESRLNKQIGRELENLSREKSRKFILPIGLILLILIGIYVLKPEITGFITIEKQFNYSDTINLEFNESSEYNWNPENQGVLISLRLSGSYKTEGNVKVYLEDNAIKYLIFDSNKLNTSSLTSITGLAVSNNKTSKDKKEKPSKLKPNTPPVWTSDINEFIIINTTIIDLNNYFSDKNNDTISYTSTTPENTAVEIDKNLITIAPYEYNFNTTITITASDGNKSTTKEVILIVPEISITPIINETIEKIININLEYDDNELYDINNDGIENIYSVVDLTVKNTIFNWPVNPNNLCTRWNIESEETSTVFCNGNNNCCSFVELSSTNNNWNETLFLTYGLYESTFNNKVSAQVIHVDYNLSSDIPYSEIYYSNWEELPVKFFDEFISFDNICSETCTLSLNKSSYKLIIEIENSILKLNKIDYITERKAENNPPILIKNISNLKLTEENLTIDLSEYFVDIDNDPLTYNHYQAKNITVNIDNNIATIIPDKDFDGIVYLFFTATDSYETVTSNVFSINITKQAFEQTIRSKVLLNKPVKWLKKIKLEKIKSNFTINISSFATNITVRKIKDNIIEEILKDKIRIRPKEKEIEVTIEDSVQEIEVEYYTEGPSSKEVVLNEYTKRIIVSSDIHYENITAFTNLPIEANSEAVKLFWLVNDTKIEVSIDKFDSNNNNLIDYIEWNIPSLSNQTYELTITILNVQSFPTVGGNWTVRFNTTGVGNLTITASNSTTYSELYDDNLTTTNDLTTLELKCDNNILFNNYDLINNENLSSNDVYLINNNNEKIRLIDTINENLKIRSLYVENYNCTGIGYWTVKVLTPGVHTQQFYYSGQIAYANNFAFEQLVISDFDKGNYTNTTSNDTGVYLVTLGEIGRANQSTHVVNTSGLILLYYFNNESQFGEATETTSDGDNYTVDFSVDVNSERAGESRNNGTFLNGATINKTDFKLGSGSAEFDGSNDYIDSSVGLGEHQYNQFTISLWHKSADTDTSDDEVFYFHQDVGLETVLFRIDDGSNNAADDNKLGLQLNVGGNPARLYISDTTVMDQNWNHLVVIRDASSITFYFNGVSDGVRADIDAGQSINIASDGTGPVIGDIPGGTEQLDGQIDELAIWNRSLSAKEIRELYYMGINATRGTYLSKVFDAGATAEWVNISWREDVPYQEEIGRVIGDDNDATLEDGFINTSGLVLLMHFNNESALGEATETTSTLDNYTVDFSVDVNTERAGQVRNNGTFFGGATINKSDYKLGGGAAEFDGINDFIEVQSNPSLEGMPALSLVAWINPKNNSGPNWGRIIHKKQSTTTDDYALTYKGSAADPICHSSTTRQYYIVLRINTDSGVTTMCSNSTIPPNTGWHHVVGIWDGTNMEIFIDGISDGIESRSGNLDDSDLAMGIGGYIDSGLRRFNGSIDEVSVWNRSLSANEILKLYKRGALRLNVSVRTCDDDQCSGETFDQSFENATKSNFTLTKNRFFQYEFNFETESNKNFTQLTPFLHNVTVEFFNVTVSSASTTDFCDSILEAGPTCFINTTHTNIGNEVLTYYGNILIGSNGVLRNNSAKTLFINITGNLTIEQGGMIDFNGSSCSSGTCTDGGNINIIADVVNISGTISAEGGKTTGNAIDHFSGSGGIITINATTIYITDSGVISASSDFNRDSTNGFIGGDAGTINLNATLVNISGTLNARGGNGDSNTCNEDLGERGNGGLVNITAITIANTGLINVERGSIGFCFGDYAISSGRDGLIFINNTLSPCNNGTIFDSDFINTCKISKGIRIPDNYVLNLSGKNYTLGAGARLNADGDSCNGQNTCQSGDDFKIIVDVLNLTTGNISSNGGSAIGDDVNHKSGKGGTIKINASIIYVGSNAEISASSDYVRISSSDRFMGGNGGTVNLNATLINISGKVNARGGNGLSNSCASNVGKRGNGGSITINSIDAEISTLNANRGSSGFCNDGDGGTVIVNTTNSLTITTISALGNGTIGNAGGDITIESYDLTVTDSLDSGIATGTTQFNGTIRLEYNNTINISLATITPGPYITKENEFGRIQFEHRMSGSNIDFNSSINITSNRISVDASDTHANKLNMTAQLKITGLSFIDVKIQKDEVDCDDAICENIVYSSSTGIVTFNVTGWSDYQAGENSTANVNISLNTTSVFEDTNDPVAVFGHINLSNGTNVSRTLVNLYINGSRYYINATKIEGTDDDLEFKPI